MRLHEWKRHLVMLLAAVMLLSSSMIHMTVSAMEEPDITESAYTNSEQESAQDADDNATSGEEGKSGEQDPSDVEDTGKTEDTGEASGAGNREDASETEAVMIPQETRADLENAGASTGSATAGKDDETPHQSPAETASPQGEASEDDADPATETDPNADPEHVEGAEDDETQEQGILAWGYCNTSKNVKWEITHDKEEGGTGWTLRISGTQENMNGYMQRPDNSTILAWNHDEIKLNSIKCLWEEYRDKIETVMIGPGVYWICDEAFAFHPALKQVIFEKRSNQIHLWMGYQVFAACPNLTEIELPSYLVRIQSNPFVDSGVTNVTLAPGTKWYSLQDGMLIEKYLANETALIWCPPDRTDKNITIPEGVTKIKGEAFYQNRQMEHVTLPDSLLTIDTGAFSGCTALQTLDWPASLEEIGSYAFFQCENLREVQLTDSLVELHNYAFYKCSSLTELTIPGSVRTTWVSGLVAPECEALETLTIGDGITTFGPMWSLDPGAYPRMQIGTLVLPATLKEIRWTQDYEVGKILFRGSEEDWEAIKKDGKYKELALVPIEFLEETQYTLSFDANGGEGEMEDLVCAKDTFIALPKATFTRPLYHFAGWKANRGAASEIIYRDEATVKNPGTRTLYAHWMENKFTVVFDGNGATGGTVAEMSVKAVTDAAKNLPQSGYLKEQHRFTGWNTKADGSGTGATRVEDIALLAGDGEILRLYAQWEERDYRIYYAYNKETAPRFVMEVLTDANGEEIDPTLYNPATGLETLPVLRAEDRRYVFAGWYRDAAFQKKITSIPKNTRGDLCLYAKISPKTYTVTFSGNADGKLYNPLTGELTEETAAQKVTGSLKTITAYCDRTLTLPANKYTRNGFYFAGFGLLRDGKVTAVFPAGAVVDPDDLLTWDEDNNPEPVTLRALWMTGGNLITLDVGEGAFDLTSLEGIEPYLTNRSKEELAALAENESVSVLEIFLPDGKTVAAKQMPTAGAYCHTFGGWFTDAAYKNKAKNLGVVKTAGVRTLYGYMKPNTAVIKFTKGAPGKSKGTMKQVKLSGMSEYTLPACTFTNEAGYTFDGWTLTWLEEYPDGYPKGNKVDIVPESDGQVFEVRAAWKPKQYYLYLWPETGDFDPEEVLPGADWIGRNTSPSYGSYYCLYDYKTTFDKNYKLPVKLEKMKTERINGEDVAVNYVLDHWEIRTFDPNKAPAKWTKTAWLRNDYTEHKEIRAVWKRKTPLTGYVYYYQENDRNSATARTAIKLTGEDPAQIRLRTTPVRAKKGYALIGWYPYYSSPYKPSLEEDYIGRYFDDTSDTYYSYKHFCLPGEICGASPGSVFYPVFANRFEAELDPAGGVFGDAVAPADGTDTVKLVYDYNTGISKAEMKLYTPVRDGYDFKGWQYTDYNGKKKTVTSLPKSFNRPVKLTAVWKAKTVKVVFYANVPKSDPLYKQVKGTMKTVQTSYGSTVKLPALKYKIKGYTFLSWSDTECDYLKRNATVGGNIVGSGDSINLTELSAYRPVIRLYATWQQDTYTITYAGKSSSPAEGWTAWPDGYTPPASYNVSTPTLTLQAPYRQGYIFRGWYSDPKYKKKITQIKKGSTGNLTLYPKWEKQK